MSTMQAIRRRERRRLAVLSILVLTATGLASCRDGHHRLTSEEAWIETSAAKGHPIAFVDRSEFLDVELPPDGRGLSRNQYVDIYRFAMRYKEQSTGPLAISHPGLRSSSEPVAHARQAIADAGIDPSRIVRGTGRDRRQLTLAFERPEAIAPQCGHWPRDVGSERERVPYPDFGCATQRNLAGMIANPRDLMGSQPESAASGERRVKVWSHYVSGEAAAAKQSSQSETASDAPAKAAKK